jgi:hypothetical protein
MDTFAPGSCQTAKVCGNVRTPRTECGGPVAIGRTSRGLAFGLGGWRLRALHQVAWGVGHPMFGIRWLGGCHLMLTQVYTSRPLRIQIPQKAGDFTKGSFHAWIPARKWVWTSLQRSSHEPHTPRGSLSRLPNLPGHAPCLPRSSGPAPHREKQRHGTSHQAEARRAGNLVRGCARHRRRLAGHGVARRRREDRELRPQLVLLSASATQSQPALDTDAAPADHRSTGTQPG